MDNTLIFIISITIAGILFTSFSSMVNKSAKAHKEEEERERKKEIARRKVEREVRQKEDIKNVNENVTFNGHRLSSDCYSTTFISPNLKVVEESSKSEIEEYEE